MNHSSVPWEIVFCDNDPKDVPWYIVDKNNQHVLNLNSDYDAECNSENARFVCHAINNHYKLLDALEMISNYFKEKHPEEVSFIKYLDEIKNIEPYQHQMDRQTFKNLCG